MSGKPMVKPKMPATVDVRKEPYGRATKFTCPVCDEWWAGAVPRIGTMGCQNCGQPLNYKG